MSARRLTKAPIRELVIDIRTSVSDNFQAKRFKAIHKRIGKDYPIIEERHRVEGHIGFGTNTIQKLDSKPTFVGYMFKSRSEKNLVQFRTDGFTVNKIQPYNSWETEIKKVKKLWPEFVRIAKPASIERIAVRAINDIKFDMSKYRLEELITIAPTVPKTKTIFNIPNFVNRTSFIDPKQNINAILLHSFEGKMENTTINFVIDIDVFKEGKISVDDASLWEQFEQLRETKNDLFFNSLTKKGLELFQ